MAYITKRGNSYSVRYTYEDEQGKNCNKWESFPTKEEATNRKKQIEHELAAGTFLIPSSVTVAEFLMDWLPKQCSKHKWAPKNLRIQPLHHPEPYHSLYWQHGDAEAQALPHGEPLHDPEQNTLRFVYRGKEAGIDRKAEAAIPFRHDDP